MRGLSEKFLRDLQKGGELNALLDAVHKDDTLCLSIRKDCINIYYRGGNICRVNPRKNGYNFFFKSSYSKEYREKIDAIPPGDCEQWIDNFPFLKTQMDFYFHENPKLEREFQQVIVRENNNSNIARDTDYFIADIEYENKKNGSRFDLLGVKWLSTSHHRRSGENAQISFMELKYGDGALKGSAGIEKHFQDLRNFLCNEKNKRNIYKEIEILFNQTLQLGLVSGVDKEIYLDSNKKPEFLLLLANHKPVKKVLLEELEKIMESDVYAELKELCDVHIASSSLLGYGLYNDCMQSLEQFVIAQE